jgi:hypothetical protein
MSNTDRELIAELRVVLTRQRQSGGGRELNVPLRIDCWLVGRSSNSHHVRLGDSGVIILEF